MSLLFSVFIMENNNINLANKSQHTILLLCRKKYINKERYGWLARIMWTECSFDLVHMPAHMFPFLWRLWALIHCRRKSMILQDQIVLAWPEVLFFWDCSLMRHSNPPSHTYPVQCHLAPSPSRLVLHSTCPDADVFSSGYSLAIVCNFSPV